MSSDEIQSIIVKVLLMTLTPIATKYGIDGNLVASIAAGAGALVVAGYSIYTHRGMKKVPNDSTAVSLPGGAAPVGNIVNTQSAKVVG